MSNSSSSKPSKLAREANDIAIVHPTEIDECELGQCASCSQKWTDQEVQYIGEEERLVHWVKFHKAFGTEEKRPSAHDCYKCWDTRRSNLGGISAPECNKSRKECPSFNVKFSELRHNKVNGLRVKQQIDVKTFLRDSEEDFGEDYDEGTFYSIVGFCNKFAAEGQI